MKENQPPKGNKERSEETPNRKPFVEPKLRRETDLLHGTAEQRYQWS